ncbi:Por secretion system C-terminal sorting domain-containing protein [Pseudarcicella hirudinis]|uniref:Por secretion system C-terminal sorting domain-containing protein n=1 Tax=Pseudarcicella hirudinis TaxID=1079859 RepID=A0A1I5NRW3_9BACT|nr:Por secretion system C-terminal sorting domain-containing protein [Pseudarcicella hirudinis]
MFGKFYFLPLLIFTFCAEAQLITVPISYPAKVKAHSSGRVGASTPLVLPFFEDFSTTKGSEPDNSNWMPGSNVFINNTYPLNHPSVNVATFDGLKKDGNAYVSNDDLAHGGTDTLTSRPIDLSNFSLKDSVYISFFWQQQGLGELPDPTDGLFLEFKTNGGIWKTVWPLTHKDSVQIDSAKIKDVKNPAFYQKLVKVDAGIYFHSDFQFRFRAVGNQSGQFDAWHVDYIYMDSKRSNTDLYVNDYAVNLPVNSILKRYTAMPLKQFLISPKTELAESVGTGIYQLWNVLNPISHILTVSDLVSNTVLQDPQPSTGVNTQLWTTVPISTKIALRTSSLQNKAILKYKFQILSTSKGSIPNVDLRINDTISGQTVLDNYYAYDDGIAEVAAYIGQGYGKLAVRYIVNKPDTVTAVRINFNPTLKDISGQQFYLQVFGNKNGQPANVLKQITATISYPQVRNGFIEFPLDPVAVTDTFYVGYTQIAENDPVVIGFDKNNTIATQHTYFDKGSGWRLSSNVDPKSSDKAVGSLMIRPVMNTNFSPSISSRPLVTEQGKAKTICLTYGDFNASDTHIARICGQGSNGTASISIDKTIRRACLTYTPNAGFKGTDQICVSICDQGGKCTQANIPVTVISTPTPTLIPQAPLLLNEPIVTLKDSSTTICIKIRELNTGDTHIANLCNALKDSARFKLSVNNSSHELCIKYSPPAGKTGADSVCVEVCDNLLLCTKVMIPIRIIDPTLQAPKTPLSNAQVIIPDLDKTVNICTSVAIQTKDSLSTTVVLKPAKGDVVISTDTARSTVCFKYTQREGIVNGYDQIVVNICDKKNQQCDLLIIPVTIINGIPQSNAPLGSEEEYQEKNLIVSPNPSSGIIRWNDNSLKMAEVVDISGKTVWKGLTENQEMDLSQLQSGVYLLRLSKGEKYFMRKIIIQH